MRVHFMLGTSLLTALMSISGASASAPEPAIPPVRHLTADEMRVAVGGTSGWRCRQEGTVCTTNASRQNSSNCGWHNANDHSQGCDGQSVVVGQAGTNAFCYNATFAPSRPCTESSEGCRQWTMAFCEAKYPDQYVQVVDCYPGQVVATNYDGNKSTASGDGCR